MATKANRARGGRPDARGKAAWTAYYNAHAEEQADLTGELSAAWSKLEEYAARLAWWSLRPLGGERSDVGECRRRGRGQHGGRHPAGDVVQGRSPAGVRRLGESDEDRDRRRLVEWIERKGGSVTPREVQQGCRWLKEPGEAEAALDELAKGWLGRLAGLADDGQRWTPRAFFPACNGANSQRNLNDPRENRKFC